jgi:hypothetical protein
MGSAPDARRTRLSSITAAAVVAAVALGATAAAGLPEREEKSPTSALSAAEVVEARGADARVPFFDASSLLGMDAPLPRAANKAVPQATRSRVRVPVIPPKTAEKPECRLDLGYGVWEIDVTAARALTMFAAVGYNRGKKIEKAARAFQRNMHIDGRLSPDPAKALERIKHKYTNPKPRQLYVDAILAMYKPNALTCVTPRREMPWQPMLTNGLTFRSQEVLFAWWEAYGGRPVGGFSPEGITSGHIENSAHYDGRAVDISFSLSDKLNSQRGWLLAHWLVANADYYQIETIIWDGLIWSNYKSAEGWRKYQHPWGPTKSPTLNHLDHIHVDVVKGWSEDMPVDPEKASAGTTNQPVRNAPKADSRVGGAD